MNSVNLIGRLGQDPEVRYLTTGSVVAELRIAVSSFSKGKEYTSWFLIKCWGKTAEIATDYAKKGDLIGISGELREETWQDRSTGENRSRVIVNANTIKLLGSKKSQQADDNGF